VTGSNVEFGNINEKVQGGSVNENKNLAENNLILYLFYVPSNLFDKEHFHQEWQTITPVPLAMKREFN
jgi:hypothetical protein